MNHIQKWSFASESCALKGRLMLKIEKLSDAYSAIAYLDNRQLTSAIAFSKEELLKRIDSNLDIFYNQLAFSLGKLR